MGPNFDAFIKHISGGAVEGTWRFLQMRLSEKNVEKKLFYTVWVSKLGPLTYRYHNKAESVCWSLQKDTARDGFWAFKTPYRIMIQGIISFNYADFVCFAL